MVSFVPRPSPFSLRSRGGGGGGRRRTLRSAVSKSRDSSDGASTEPLLSPIGRIVPLRFEREKRCRFGAKRLVRRGQEGGTSFRRIAETKPIPPPAFREDVSLRGRASVPIRRKRFLLQGGGGEGHLGRSYRPKKMNDTVQRQRRRRGGNPSLRDARGETPPRGGERTTGGQNRTDGRKNGISDFPPDRLRPVRVSSGGAQ